MAYFLLRLRGRCSRSGRRGQRRWKEIYTSEHREASTHKISACLDFVGRALNIWVLTDGKIGDDVQCLAVAGALSPDFEKRVIAPRWPWHWLAPWGPMDPYDAPHKQASPIAPPYPDLLIASGRRAVPYARAVKRASGGKTFVVIMKDPRIAPRHADLIWAPMHDRLTGANVVSTLTSPHGLAAKIAAARGNPAPAIAKLPKPMLGVVLGGPSGSARFSVQSVAGLTQKILSAKKNFASLAVVASRRTPANLLRAVGGAVTGPDVFVWDGAGDNPYIDILANARALIITADSHNMMSEAVATGAAVYAWRPPGLVKKLGWFIDQLEGLGTVRPLAREVEIFAAAPIDATAEIVAEIRRRLKGA